MTIVNIVTSTAAALSGVIATGVSMRQQRKATKKQKQAREIEQRKSDFKQAQQNRKALAKQQASIASAQAQGAATGIGDSSALSGSVSSVKTQTASNIGFAEQINSLTRQQNSLVQSASGDILRSNNAKALGSLAGSAFSATGGFSAFSGIGGSGGDSAVNATIAARQASGVRGGR